MWGFEASALAFIQFFGTLASTRELIAEAGAAGAVTGDSERVLSSRSCVSFLSRVMVFWLRDRVSAKCRSRHGAFPYRCYPSNERGRFQGFQSKSNPSSGPRSGFQPTKTDRMRMNLPERQ